MDFKKEDWKFAIGAIAVITIFLLILIGPKIYWLDGGGFVWR